MHPHGRAGDAVLQSNKAAARHKAAARRSPLLWNKEGALPSSGTMPSIISRTRTRKQHPRSTCEPCGPVLRVHSYTQRVVKIPGDPESAPPTTKAIYPHLPRGCYKPWFFQRIIEPAPREEGQRVPRLFSASEGCGRRIGHALIDSGFCYGALSSVALIPTAEFREPEGTARGRDRSCTPPHHPLPQVPLRAEFCQKVLVCC